MPFAVLMLALDVEPTSVRDAEAAEEVEPRASLPCVPWKRDTGVFVAAVDSETDGRVALRPEGVGGGEMKATFF